MLVGADLINIGGPETLLATSKALGGWRLLAHEEGLERDHTGTGEKQGRVPCRYQRSRGHVLVALTLEKPDERGSYLVAIHCSTLRFPFSVPLIVVGGIFRSLESLVRRNVASNITNSLS